MLDCQSIYPRSSSDPSCMMPCFACKHMLTSSNQISHRVVNEWGGVYGARMRPMMRVPADSRFSFFVVPGPIIGLQKTISSQTCQVQNALHYESGRVSQAPQTGTISAEACAR